MLRLTFSAAKGAFRPVARAAIAARPALMFARFESTTPSAPKYKSKEEGERKASLLQDWEAPVISYAELKPKTQSPAPNSYLIDVREPDEVAQGMIPSAVNLPLSTLGDALNLNDADFKKTYGFDKPKRHQEVTFYCRSGKRSSTASDVAERNGYKRVLNYKGSWLEWTKNEVEGAEKTQ